MMRRWILKAGVKGLDQLLMEKASVPEPGPGEVRVRMRAVSLNYRDQSILQRQVTEDLIPVSDGAGEIDAIGGSVTQWSIGDRVTSLFFKDWVDGPPVPSMGAGSGSPGEQGMLAEYVILKADRIASAPKTLTFVEASTLPCAALTAWTALNGNRPYVRRVGKGDKVLVLGTGGVSLFALLLAKSAGAEVIGTSSQDDKLERLRSLGAVDGVNYKTIPNWGEVIFERTGGLRSVVNPVGGAALDQSIAAVAYGGEIANVSILNQAQTPPNLMFLMMKGASIRGIAVGGAAAYGDLVNAVDSQGIKPPIDRVLPFEQAKEAYQSAVAPGVFGKIVIEIA
jgi:NADPH:quinone reductase-like Zn-dependent oxidoreductase